MAQRLKVLLLAEEAAGIQTIKLLAESPHQVVAVLTASGGSGMGSGATVSAIASRAGFPVWPLRLVREKGFAERIRREAVDLLLNVHALCVLPPDVVAAPRVGSFNLHPGPLPNYAGLNAPSWAIYQGERRHAVTVHWMDGGIDTGPIAYETELDISDEDTGFSLSAKCVRAGLPMLRELLAAAAEGAPPRNPQPAGSRRYYGREVPQDGWIDWTMTATEVVNFVRACDYMPFPSPWGQPRAAIAGRELSVLKVTRTGERCSEAPGKVGARVGDEVLVASADEWVQLRRIQVSASVLPAGRFLQPGQQFDLPIRSEEAVSAAQ
jgi:UDP-4-amino-4-deoxy-L-arabinose formyltransferase/UDP-glucuronic acid dehydrogenase (UDP-4-keto-hexauronic acid decarboxylating)